MIHDFSPFIFKFSDDFGLRWYGLSYLMGFFLSYLLLTWMVRRQKFGISPHNVMDIVTFGAVGILVGGRLGYIFFYAPEILLNFKKSFPYWGLFALNEGGMSSHGGILGLILALSIYSIKHGVHQLYLFDLAALAGPVGIFLGRLANFINGELVGRPCDPSFPLAVRFPQDILQWGEQSNVHKLKTLTPVMDLLPQVGSHRWEEWISKLDAHSEASISVQNTLSQILIEIQNGNESIKQTLAPLLEFRHPSQLYAAAGEGLFLFLLLFLLWKKPRKPGVIGTLFVIFYAAVRIFDEEFRLPDAHIGFQLFGLTRGQWLSIGMLVVGLVLIVFWTHRETLKIPGWDVGKNVRLHRR